VPSYFEYVDDYLPPIDYQGPPPPAYPDPRYPAPSYPPSYGYPVAPQYEMPAERQRKSKAVLGGLAAGWFLGAWLLAAVHPAITLGMWFLGIGFLIYRALR